MSSISAISAATPSLGSVNSLSPTQPSFSTVFTSMLDSMNQYQEQAAQQVREVALGQGEVGINDLMVSMQKATLSLQLGVQVRNKMIAAYNEVMNMSV